ncbi:MAG: short-chain dehydrogenase [Euryarchaeota archaeon]|jgi:3-oxoacyl-[acyl-carrier protein] reductase|nr:short-chain dehydrogenase [Euryarchaeota archaeon]
MNKLLKEEFSFADEILKGYTALVCGASKGIGKATAQMLSRAGARVILCARSKLELNEVVSELHGEGHKILVMDLEDIEAIEENILTLIGEVGDIQILINNSGGPPGGPLIENDITDFDGPFKRHLYASHVITKLLIPGMERSQMGRIINVISTSVREPIDNIGLSNTLRGAMASWSKSLSREINPCITINNILPGFTDTDRLSSLSKSISEKTGKSINSVREEWMNSVPIQRLIDPLETANAITWLSLPSSGAIRGISLAVDGGRMRSI